jgi:hypothetical protein
LVVASYSPKCLFGWLYSDALVLGVVSTSDHDFDV